MIKIYCSKKYCKIQLKHGKVLILHWWRSIKEQGGKNPSIVNIQLSNGHCRQPGTVIYQLNSHTWQICQNQATQEVAAPYCNRHGALGKYCSKCFIRQIVFNNWAGVYLNTSCFVPTLQPPKPPWLHPEPQPKPTPLYMPCSCQFPALGQ